MSVKKFLFVLSAIFFLIAPTLFSGLAHYAPGMAIVVGVLFALTLGNPFLAHTVKWTHLLLGLAIVGIGFGMDLFRVLRAGADGMVYTVIGIAAGLGMGLAIGKKLRVPNDCTWLIAVGTSICGGSAIAAVAPVLKAKAHDIAIAVATVFILNGVALLIFPPLGHWMGFTQHQFGLWAALAIHDTSSVVGASFQYGSIALETGTTVKLARALWIVAVTMFVAWAIAKPENFETSAKRRFTLKIPWFIPGFLIAAALVSYLPQMTAAGLIVKTAAQNLMVMTLFLIGANLSMDKIRELGIRPFVLGVTLWVILATAWAAAIYCNLVK